MQYNNLIKKIPIYYTLHCIVIYCNVCCVNVVNVQSLHHKNHWTSSNLDNALDFLYLITWLHHHSVMSHWLLTTYSTHHIGHSNSHVLSSSAVVLWDALHCHPLLFESLHLILAVYQKPWYFYSNISIKVDKSVKVGS